jgi:hypothetical protein
MFLDLTIMRKILELTCEILEHHFYYEKETICRFLDAMENRVLQEVKDINDWISNEEVKELIEDKTSRMYFTCYFISANLRDTLVKDLHFSSQELHAFEAFLPATVEPKSSLHKKI